MKSSMLSCGTGLLLAACSETRSPAGLPQSDAASDHVATSDVPPDVDVPLGTDVPTPRDAPATTDVTTSDTCRGPAADAWTSDPRLCLVTFATGLPGARGFAFASNGDLFVISAGSIVALFDADGDGASSAAERATFASAAGLNHGITFSPDGRYLYASSDTAVYRWPYAAGARTPAGPREVAVTDMPGGGHASRPMVFGPDGSLYVMVGSAGNVDTSMAEHATRSMIRRFAPRALPAAWSAGEVFASGLRNEAGLTVDRAGRMWGVENGRDDLQDPRFGGDIHGDNPAEEINRFDRPAGAFYGYPWCYSEFALAGGAGAGTQHQDRNTGATNPMTEADCQDPSRVVAPAFAMQGHWAPLGISEYTGSVLPAAWRGSLFVAAHGSWNRDTPTGRLIARAQVNPDGHIVGVEPVVGERDRNGSLRQGLWDARPVDIHTGADGALYFSDDSGGRVFRIGYR